MYSGEGHGNNEEKKNGKYYRPKHKRGGWLEGGGGLIVRNTLSIPPPHIIPNYIGYHMSIINHHSNIILSIGLVGTRRSLVL